MQDSIKVELGPGKGRKACKEFLGSTEITRKTGRRSYRERFIDREQGVYLEKVTDPETGEVIHECNEPHPNHQGRGSAKKKGA